MQEMNHSKICKCPPDRWLCHRPIASTVPEATACNVVPLNHNSSTSWTESKQTLHDTVFPPAPMSKVNIAHLVQGFIDATSAAARACAVCAQLVNQPFLWNGEFVVFRRPCKLIHMRGGDSFLAKEAINL